MNRPLWQIFLAMIFAAYGLARAGTAVVLLSHEGADVLALSQAFQAAGGLLGAAGFWVGGHARTVGLIVLGMCLGAAHSLQLIKGIQSVSSAVAQVAVVVAGLSLLGYLSRLAEDSDPDSA